jgi:hypothetical protein
MPSSRQGRLVSDRDPGGRLIAAHLYTDYAAYCGGRSFTRAFGRVPTCGTKPLERNLCQRPPLR